jgi:hypothetical protein
MEEAQRLRIVKRLAELEPDYQRYVVPDTMLALKASVLDRVWKIFSGSVIKPEAAPFVIGRMYEVLEPYREALYTIKEYEGLTEKLAEEQMGEAKDANL